MGSNCETPPAQRIYYRTGSHLYFHFHLDHFTTTRICERLVDSGFALVHPLVELLTGARDHDPAALAYGIRFAKTYRFRGVRGCRERRVHLCFTARTTVDRCTTEVDMSVQVESEDQEEIVTNTPSKRRTRAMRIIDDDDESAGEEDEDEIDEEEEDAEGVSLPSLTAILVSNHFGSDSQKRTSWSPTRSRNFQSLLPRG